MNFLNYINFYYQCLSALLFSIGVFGWAFESELEPYHNDDIGLILLLAVLFYTGLFQFITTVLGTFCFGKRSKYWSHFLWCIGYFVYVGILTLVLKLFGLENALNGLFGTKSRAFGLVFFLPAILLMFNYYFITFTKLNPHKAHNNEKNQ